MDAQEDIKDLVEGFGLSTAEVLMVGHINHTMDRDQVLTRLKGDLQAAIAVELATIPIYLYTYYSIYRNKVSGENLTEPQQFANQAGGVIMSVAVEEMLHMSLSSNIYFALTGEPPVLYKNAPGEYPAMLPHHNPVGPPGPHGGVDTHIPLGVLSFEQLWHFLQIEYPQYPTNETLPFEALFEALMHPEKLNEWLHQHGWPSDQNWNSIGQFYSYIRCLIASRFITDADFQNGGSDQQIQPYNYAPNNIDTLYPKEKFNSWRPAPGATWTDADKAAAGDKPDFMRDDVTGAAQATVYSNAPDSHEGPSELITISSRKDAFLALETICEQGEGFANPGGAEAPTDDPSKEEESHFFKFLELQSQFAEYAGTSEQLPAWMQKDLPDDSKARWTKAELIDEGVMYDFPDNPVTADYPAEYAALSDFCNGCFQYMLVLSETIYLVEPGMTGPNKNIPSQHHFFNVALHRSMIWVLDKYIQFMRVMKIPDGKHAGKAFAPTFENIDLGTRAESFDRLKDLGEKARWALDSLVKKGTIKSTNGYDLIDQAISKMSATGCHPMHLPDVRKYWHGKG